MTSTATFHGLYSGETSDGKVWTTTRRYLSAGRYAYVVRFLAGQGVITSEHKAAARTAIGASC